MHDKIVAITGASGALGSAGAKLAIAQEAQVVAIDVDLTYQEATTPA